MEQNNLHYMSEERLQQLKDELKQLKTAERQAISKRLEDAKKLGDLSENAEYAEAKEAQEHNEQRIIELEQMLKDAVLIEKTTHKYEVAIGSTIEVVDGNGSKRTFTIVGSEEVDPVNGKISNESPLGQAFLGHKTGETVEAKTPNGPAMYKISKIV